MILKPLPTQVIQSERSISVKYSEQFIKLLDTVSTVYFRQVMPYKTSWYHMTPSIFRKRNVPIFSTIILADLLDKRWCHVMLEAHFTLAIEYKTAIVVQSSKPYRISNWILYLRCISRM